MLVRLKAYRWFILGIAAAVLALGGAAQAGLISPDFGGGTSLDVALTNDPDRHVRDKVDGASRAAGPGDSPYGPR